MLWDRVFSKSNLWPDNYSWDSNLVTLVNDLYLHFNESSNTKGRFCRWQQLCVILKLENVEHCGGEPEQAANMHMNRLSFTLK